MTEDDRTRLSELIEKYDNEMISLKEKTLCFIGCVEYNFLIKMEDEEPLYLFAKEIIKNKLEEMIKRGYRNFISNLAPGFEMVCAEIILELEQDYPTITLECTLPDKEYTKEWGVDLQNKYNYILNRANYITYFSETKSPCGEEEINNLMVNKSSLAIVLYDENLCLDSPVLNYANKIGIKIEKISFKAIDFFK